MIKKRISNILFISILIVLAILFAFPIFWTFTMVFKERSDIFTMTPPILPTHWTLANLKEAISISGALNFFKNSLIVSIATSFIVVVLSTTCGYGLRRLAGRSSKRLSQSILMMRMVPIMVMTIPLFLIFKSLDLNDSLPSLILCYAALSLPLAIWLCMGFYGSIPDSIYEAAVVDGASEFRMFFNISLPLIANSIVVVVLLTFFFAWNELALAMVLINKDEYRTMAVGIRYWTADAFETPYARMAAAGIICIIPTIIITIMAQKYLVKGFTGGAIKG